MDEVIETYRVEISYNDLVKLDGNCSADIQSVVNRAKLEHGFGFELPLMGKILAEAQKNGKLTWTYKTVRSCKYCDKSYRYHPLKRSSSRGRKGSPDHNRPISYSGIAFNEGFITVAGYGDMCIDCEQKYKVKETLISYIVEHDMKIELPKHSPVPTKYLKDEIRTCYECEQEMQESLMGRSPAIFEGSYPSTCPNCGAKSSPFGRSHKMTDKFVMIAAEQANAAQQA